MNLDYLEIFVSAPNYKVDEKELERSIEKNKAIIERAREGRRNCQKQSTGF